MVLRNRNWAHCVERRLFTLNLYIIAPFGKMKLIWLAIQWVRVAFLRKCNNYHKLGVLLGATFWTKAIHFVLTEHLRFCSSDMSLSTALNWEFRLLNLVKVCVLLLEICWLLIVLVANRGLWSKRYLQILSVNNLDSFRRWKNSDWRTPVLADDRIDAGRTKLAYQSLTA